MGVLKMEGLRIIQFTAPQISGIASLIYEIVKICSSVALGVILFTVALKLITLPFDYASKASMRKNSVKMEKMRPELEKLQKQYADNKELYNQKMMALYKKNGYSMFGACLPTILTLVIFIVAINAFTDYSKFQNKQYFYNMASSYNNVVYAGFEISDETTPYIYRTADGEFMLNADAIINAEEKQETEDGYSITVGSDSDSAVSKEITINFKNNGSVLTVWTTNGYTKCQYNLENKTKTYTVDTDKLREASISEKDIENGIKQKSPLANNENNNLLVNGKTFAEMESEGWTAEQFINDIRAQKSADRYNAEKQTFFWVENIWATDSPMAHPIEKDWAKFKTTHAYEGADLGEDYTKLISKLETETTAPNGYFILVALTVLTSFLMQVVMGKANQAQMELQTVDGQGAQTQKMMKWMMPIMMGFFAFMYTAAFSIYIITSSVISMLTTFGINFIVDKKIEKEEAKANTGKVYSKVRVIKEEVKKEKEQPKKEKKKIDDKFSHETGGDFLTGKKKK